MGGEARSVGAWRRACWRGGRRGRKHHRGLPHQRCRTQRPHLCYRHHTGSSSVCHSEFEEAKARGKVMVRKTERSGTKACREGREGS